jgi:putative ABC transport system substrate-binding protein
MPGRPDIVDKVYDSFFAGMRELGYVEGRNVVYQTRWGMGRGEGLPRLAAELIALNPNVIVVAGGRAINAVRQATQVIPVVVPFTSDLLGQGFVASLADPGGNITGLSAMSVEISAKRIELLKQALPKLARLAVVWNSALGKDARWEVIEAAARALDVELESVEVRDAAGLEDAFISTLPSRVDAVYVINDRFTRARYARIIELAAKARLAAMYDFREYADAGGLMSYGPSVPDMWRRAASYVDRILKGAKPADLPVEQPTKFELVINLKTAKAIGIKISEEFLLRADQVIE